MDPDPHGFESLRTFLRASLNIPRETTHPGKENESQQERRREKRKSEDEGLGRKKRRRDDEDWEEDEEGNRHHLLAKRNRSSDPQGVAPPNSPVIKEKAAPDVKVEALDVEDSVEVEKAEEFEDAMTAMEVKEEILEEARVKEEEDSGEEEEEEEGDSMEDEEEEREEEEDTSEEDEYDSEDEEYFPEVKEEVPRDNNGRVALKERPQNSKKKRPSSLPQKEDEDESSQSPELENPYPCPRCPQSFMRAAELKAHVKRRHTKEKPYKCYICKYRTSERHRIRRHQLTHLNNSNKGKGSRGRRLAPPGKKSFSCKFCDFRTFRWASLKIHEWMHIGQRAFTCSFCDYRASHRSEMKTHMMRHTGEKPFKCDLCDFAAIRRRTVSHHVDTKHKENSI